MSEQQNVPHAITWFEIPSTNFDRAVGFYEQVLGKALKRDTMAGEDFAVFPYEPTAGVGGCILAGERIKPGEHGTNVYFYAEDGLDGPLSRVSAAGGEVLQPVTFINAEIGYVAQIRDSEGNRVGLHSSHA